MEGDAVLKVVDVVLEVGVYSVVDAWDTSGVLNVVQMLLNE